MKMLDVLQVVGTSTVPLGLQEIANELDLDKSTVGRMLASLMQRDFVNRDPNSRKYRIGPGFLGLSTAVTSRAEILRMIHPYMVRLREQTAETVALHVRANFERICISALERFPPNLERRRQGVRTPLYHGTAGKVILAFLPAKHQETIIAAAVEDGYDREHLLSKLEAVREQGYLDDIGDKQPQLGAISAPLFEGSKVFGSLVVTGPIGRMHEQFRREIAPIVRETAVAISDVVTASNLYIYQGEG